jgi:hypothetical protein
MKLSKGVRRDDSGDGSYSWNCLLNGSALTRTQRRDQDFDANQ